MKSGATRKAPAYMPPPAYQSPTYTNPTSFQPPTLSPLLSVPAAYSPGEVMSIGTSLESQLPQWLQVNKDPMSSDLLGQYGEDYYRRNIIPAIEAEKAKLGLNGQQYGTPAWAMLGQMASQGQFDKFQASLGFGQQLFNNQLQGRESWFNGGARVAQEQNASDIQRGLGVANLLQQESNAANTYNLSNAQMANNFNLGNSQNLNNHNLTANQNLNSYAQKLFSDQLARDTDLAKSRTYAGLALGQGLSGLIGRAIGGRKSSTPAFAPDLAQNNLGALMPPFAPDFAQNNLGSLMPRLAGNPGAIRIQ